MNTAYVAIELKRSVRNPRYLVFTVVMPLVLFLVIAKGNKGTVDGTDVTTWIMVNMAVFGALSGVLNLGGRIAVERDAGWNRQLRLTPMRPVAYVAGKVVTGMLLALASILIVCLAGGALLGVHLTAAQWAEVVALAWISLLPLAAVGVAIGYLARGDSAQAVTGAVMLLLSMFGGLWFPVDQAPSWLRDVAHALPTYWIGQLSRAPLSHDWPAVTGYVVLAVWALVGVRVAVRRYRVDALRAA
jgi:ABC-2 type transport system permease protein